MVFERNDNKLDYCQYCRWFLDEGEGGMCPMTPVYISIHPTHSLNTIKGLIIYQTEPIRRNHQDTQGYYG